MTQLLSAKLIGKMDLPKLAKSMDRKERKVLFRTAAYARTTMRRGMRRRKKPGPVGGYPSSHAGQLRDLIAFAVDTSAGTAVVGPALFNSNQDGLSGATTIPQLLNEGGTATKMVNKKQKTYRYKPRPFVRLANEVAAKKFAENMENIPLGV